MTNIPIASLADMLTISTGLLLWFSTVIGFVWWLNNRFNRLMSHDEYDRRHEELSERVRLIELKLARICAELKMRPNA